MGVLGRRLCIRCNGPIEEGERVITSVSALGFYHSHCLEKANVKVSAVDENQHKKALRVTELEKKIVAIERALVLADDVVMSLPPAPYKTQTVIDAYVSQRKAIAKAWPAYVWRPKGD